MHRLRRAEDMVIMTFYFAQFVDYMQGIANSSVKKKLFGRYCRNMSLAVTDQVTPQVILIIEMG